VLGTNAQSAATNLPSPGREQPGVPTSCTTVAAGLRIRDHGRDPPSVMQLEILCFGKHTPTCALRRKRQRAVPADDTRAELCSLCSHSSGYHGSQLLIWRGIIALACLLLLAPVSAATNSQAAAALSFHAAATPVSRIGSWVLGDPARDWLTTNISEAHLACLNTERQGNCYNDTANLMAHDSARRSRYEVMKRNHSAIYNDMGILQGRNIWAWRVAEDMDALEREMYSPVAWLQTELVGAVAAFVRSGHKFFIIGDSLSRQFARTMQCSLEFKLGVTKQAVVWIGLHYLTNQSDLVIRLLTRNNVTSKDVVVVNIGHHIDPGNSEYLRAGVPPHWETTTQVAWRAIFHAFAWANLDPRRVFVRTTVPRFVRRDGGGDWDGGRVICGAKSPEPNARWSAFGGQYLSQPKQNEIHLNELNRTPWQLLDVAPLTLARADATFDCLHMCLPGVMDTWVSLLLNHCFFKRG